MPHYTCMHCGHKFWRAGSRRPGQRGIIELLGFHYKTAFIHGYGHGVEDGGRPP